MLKKYKKGLKTQLSKNFSSTEMDCKCNDPECQWTIIESDHIDNLQAFRDKIGKSITVNCGYRCEKHNTEVGGATKSQHMEGYATDIVVKGMTPEEVAAAAEEFGFKGIGKYDTFTHVDSREKPARWDFTRKE